MMRHKILMTALLLALEATGAAAQDAEIALAKFVDAGGKPNGNAIITDVAAGGVLFMMEVTGLPPEQWVAVHIHEIGKCDAATHHTSAGNHFDPGVNDHGYKSVVGPHAGDLPNQYVGSDGVLHAQIFNSMVSLDGSEDGIRGRALMVHNGPDDYESQPSGNAGERLACAVIE